MLETSDLETRAYLMGLEDEIDFETLQDENETYHTGGSEEEVYNYVGRVDDSALYDNLKSEVLNDIRKYVDDRMESEAEEDEDIIEEDEDVQVIRPIEIYYTASDASDMETVSSNQVFVLNDEQFQALLAEIRTNTEETRPVVVDTSVSNDLIPVKNAGESSFIVSVITFGLLFGYLAKESIFKGV